MALTALRLYPVLGQSGRTALRDTVLPRGGAADGSGRIFVPSGSIVVNNFYALHRQSGAFGEDPDTFRPDRWNHIRPKECEYMPFGYGRRCCLGEEKALLDASFLLAELAYLFSRIESRDSQEWRGDWRLTVRNLNGCKIALLVE